MLFSEIFFSPDEVIHVFDGIYYSEICVLPNFEYAACVCVKSIWVWCKTWIKNMNKQTYMNLIK